MSQIKPKLTPGELTCARYALAPNMLGYCGPDRHHDLAGYIKENTSDRGLSGILNDFGTLSPYLQLIGSENNIGNIYRPDVVKAYWLGNKLLSNVKKPVLYRHLDKHFYPRMDRVNKQKFKNLRIALPNHNFHVLSIFVRTGHIFSKHTLDSINKCRISWGKVVGFEDNLNKLNSGYRYKILVNQLIISSNQLAWSKPIEIISIGYFRKYQIGDTVSLHWDQICDRLTIKEVRSLLFYTNLAIHEANISGLVYNL